jgi:hypothetical protein
MSRRTTPARAPGYVVALVLAAIGVLATVPAAGASAPGVDEPPAVTVLVGAPGLAWSDIDERTTPELWTLATDGAVGSMTVRGVRSRSCGADGWLTLSAGRRAADADEAACTEPEPVVDDTVPNWDRFVAAAEADSYGAVPGTLGQRLTDAGVCVTTVGPGAAIAGADEDGRVEHRLDGASAEPPCDVELVDVGTLPADGPARTAALQRLDALVGSLVRGSDRDRTRLVVAGVGDGASTVAPRAVVVSDPSGAGVLTSPSTRQDGLVQLQDLTASLLVDHGSGDVGLTGRPVVAIPDEGSGEDRIAARQGFERRAMTMRALAPQVTTWLSVLFVAWAVLVAGLRWKGRPAPRALAVLGVAVAVVPVATFLADLVPWWRVDAAGPAFVVVLAGVTAATTLVALAAARTVALGALRTVAVVTLLVLGGDVLTGSTLQLASVFGQNPTVGGRFYGLGNTSFALYGLATLVVVEWVGSSRRLGRRWSVGLGALVLLAALALEAHPSLGADFGGPPGLLLGGAVVLAAVAGVRLTPWRLAVAVLAAGGLTLAVAVFDWLRPPEARTHLGAFVQTALDGGAADVVSRKLAQNLQNLGSPPLVAIALATAVLVVVLRRTGWRPGPHGGVVVRAAVVMSAVGFAVNDSGLVIPAYTALVLLPLLLVSDEGESTTTAVSVERLAA